MKGAANLSSNLSTHAIKVPDRVERVCNYSPIPPGYRITQLIHAPSCVGGIVPYQGYLISR
jgi:hypothetical protein